MASDSKGLRKLRFSECTCPVCLCILIKPVTFPCGHELCITCFNQHVMKASLLCPLCRVRISVWVRRATRQNQLVNEKRWEEIQNAFPEKVKNRLEEKEEDEIDDDFEGDYYVPQIAEPGEVRKEFEEQKGLVDKDWLSRQREEEEASRRLIAELMDEEAKREEQERKDAELAAALNKQINEVCVYWLSSLNVCLCYLYTVHLATKTNCN
ncbi:hypothetical protein LSH36_24g05004 [Paralvinella palmiformis]|uniref:RING-type E3 ubiquitin transferase n=1 Tax=Paralvinella palmiformis TaxID=53620 RepID=A0AAD9NEY3_9ANNE|nr:hypothetical protein LSH36_24g05004 [Paralvinella palmiformis]